MTPPTTVRVRPAVHHKIRDKVEPPEKDGSDEALTAAPSAATHHPSQITFAGEKNYVILGTDKLM